MNRSTYYKHYNTPESARSKENAEIRRAILQIYIKAKQRYGAVRIRQCLQAEYGISISLGRVYRLMKAMELPAMATVKPRQPGKPKEASSDLPNILQKRFSTDAPNRVWVSDITYIKVSGRFCHLCTIIDLFARKVIAFRVAYKADADLVIQTVMMALRNRGNPKGVLFHSDRGTQYTAAKFRRLLDELGFIQSFSAVGHPYDNAVAESFFKSLKHEETGRRRYLDLDDLSLSIFEYIHFFNTQRPHSANGGLTPEDTENAYFIQLPSDLSCPLF